MDWTSLIGAGSSLLGGLFGDDKKSTEQTTTLSPELQSFIDDIFKKIPSVFNRPYPEYQGERVAQPTANRAAMDPLMASVSSQLAARNVQGNPYQQRINQMMNMSPVQIAVPDLLGRSGAAGVGMAGGYNDAPPSTITDPMRTPWLYGQVPEQPTA